MDETYLGKVNSKRTMLKRGMCLIVNQKDFSQSKTHETRDGTDLDEKELRRVWALYNTDTHVLRDLKKSDIKDKLLEFRKKTGKAIFEMVL